jgi:glycine/D-amino acid oxidase-like deaminating enzyme
MTPSEVPFVSPVPGKDLSTGPYLVVMAGMSGIGAKGSMAYGKIAARYISGESDDSPRYQKTYEELGIERILQFRAGIQEVSVNKRTL